ncbi:MAG: flagellar biosynthesis protein FlhA [Acidimicrobiales bacterium]
MNSRTANLMLPMFVLGAIVMMIIPVSPLVLDLFLALNIALGVLLMLTVINLSDTLDLSIFPALLLVMTLVRLALNVSSTRLILLDGYAGKVIATFGSFVVGGSVIVGLVVFLILIVIQFAVVTNGAGRVAEVAARFTLDAMPGKQMAIDADLSSGLIDEAQAREKRERIAKEADFYGAMDGASKFVKGDVLAGVIIVLINLFGGLAMGMLAQGLSVGEAISTYTLLTVGDGLVSQIPAIMTSISAGLLVTRVGGDEDLGAALAQQLLTARKAMRMASYVIGAIALLPGLPWIPFVTVAVTLWILSGRVPTEVVPEPEEEIVVEPGSTEAIIDDMRVEPLELRLSYDVLDLVDPSMGGDLLDRVKALRRQIAMELGIVMPLVRTRDDVGLATSTYAIEVDGAEIATGSAPRGQVLVLPASDSDDLRHLGGIETVEPAFGLKAWWVPESASGQASALGGTVVDRSTAVVTHLAEVVRATADRLLTRQDVQMLVDGLRYDHPILVKDIDNDVVPLGTLHRVLQALLQEGVSIRQLARIVDAVSGTADKPLDDMVSAGRVALGGAIVRSIDPQSRLASITIDPMTEVSLHEALRDIDGERRLVLDPERGNQIVAQINSAVASRISGDPAPAVICAPGLRRPLQRFLAAHGLSLPVLAYPEIPSTVNMTGIAVIGTAPQSPMLEVG